MKHILKIVALLTAISAIWVSLLETSLVPRSYTWLLPIYLIVVLGCYGLLMVGVGLMVFPTCPEEAVLLQKVYEQITDCLKLPSPAVHFQKNQRGVEDWDRIGRSRTNPDRRDPGPIQDISEAKEFLKQRGIHMDLNKDD